MHANDQIAVAIAETLRTQVPTLLAVSRYGVPPSLRRTYPNAVVIPDAGTVETQLSGNRRAGRVQTRTMQLGVAIRDKVTADVDTTARLFDLVEQVEVALAAWDVLPIDDIVLVAVSEVQDIQAEGRAGPEAGIGLVFEVRFYTVEGSPTEILEPND